MAGETARPFDLTRKAAAASLAGAWGAFFLPHLLGGVPYYRDHLLTNVPLRAYVRERLLSGELPQWYPFESLGVPVIGQVALGTFHPLNLLLTPLSAAQGEKWALLISFALALAGAYRLARAAPASRLASMAGAFAYGFGGYALGVSSIIAYSLSTAALPWVGWAVLRVARQGRVRDVATLAACWSLVFLAGDAVSFMLLGLLVPLLLTAPLSPSGVEGPSTTSARPSVSHAAQRARYVALCAGAGVWAVALTAVEFLPALVVSQEAVRRVGVPSPTLGLTWALHPLRLPELALSGFVPDEVRHLVTSQLLGGGSAAFATTVFAGALVLALAVAGVGTRRPLALGFAVLGLLGVWLALGDRGGLLPLAKRLLPLLGQFRYPQRYLALLWLALAPLVALGADEALRAPLRWRVALPVLSLPAVAVAAFSALGDPAGALFRAFGQGSPWDEATRALVNGAWLRGALSAACFLVLGALVLEASRRRAAMALALPALVLLELWHGNGEHLPLLPAEVLTATNPLIDAVRARSGGPGPGPRVFSMVAVAAPSTVTSPYEEKVRWVRAEQHTMPADVAGLYGVATLNDNLGARTARNALLLGEDASPRAALLNGCLAVVPQRRAGPTPVAMSDAEVGLALVEVPCRPRAFVAPAVAVATRDEALARLPAAGDAEAAVPWEGGPTLPGGRGRATWVSFRPERLELDVEVESAPAALVVSDEVAPGWTAQVDGAEVPVHPTMVAVRGVEVGVGKHRVVFTYRTPLLGAGLASSGLGWAAVAWVAFRRRRAGSGA